ncbi:Kdo hydroxylase family protein [Candidatus Methylacidithermus pantelleriae]|uniref:3-deoxy-D-manno-oct-2-ulosonic acid (Kdo) hydroxylase n=1 Tax=Candidatus Methylacidithermus pantelleriae TaxID=2744239 RepID=A0A8J2BPE7_9BACT|nr:Kdo hydroxylase family protein [Candidatus Methylacidithermus pantelleriae]CAF0696191.1 conserved hypothetical protein [Candidatus Methylacidithermus pantelleriae]
MRPLRKPQAGSYVITYSISSWEPELSPETREELLEDLEGGRVIYFPELAFSFSEEEKAFFSPYWSTEKAKNISFDPVHGQLKGTEAAGSRRELLASLLGRFASQTQRLIRRLFPSYESGLEQGRTSFRPVEIQGRAMSVRKDDSRLHADAFPSRPTQGKRILRVFSNVNPEGKPRKWRMGEPFAEYARRLLPRARPPAWLEPWLLEKMGITRGRRTLYDHYMLALHDLGKEDEGYQKQGTREAFDFPAGTTWICFTDQVIHAADAGQYLLEQTFLVSPQVLRYPDNSPLGILQTLLGKPLV